jgi:hypothetical protein
MTTISSTATTRARKGSQGVSETWAVFVKKLAAVLKERDVGDLLTLQDKDSGEWIQFATEKSSFRIEVKSNHFREDDAQLSVEQVIGLSAIGWSAPTGNPEQSTPSLDINGSPNFFVDVRSPIKLKTLETLIARTFIEVFRVSTPDALVYESYDCEGNSLSLTTLGIRPVIYFQDSNLNPKLPQLVLNVVREITSIKTLDWDHEGDIGGITLGGIAAYIRLVEDRPYLRIYTPILMDAHGSPELLEKLNELNTINGFLHVCLMPNNCVMAVSDLLVSPFITSHVANALGNYLQTADEYATELESAFGANAVQSQQQLWH